MATAFAEPVVAATEEKPDGFRNTGFLITLITAFFGGMALNLTPCVYPLIPITVTYFGGRTGQARARIAVHGACYIGGLAITNSILGVMAALTGGIMGALLQHPWVLVGIAGVLVALGTSLFGLWELRMPFGLIRMASKSHAGFTGSVFMGLTLGIIAAPCIGPFVLGLLTWVAGTGDPLTGFSVFFTLSLGLGLPLFFLAIFSGHLDRLPQSGEWMLWIRKLMGWVLMGMAAYFLGPVLPHGGGRIAMAVVAVAAGLHLGWVDRTRPSEMFAWIKTGIALGCLIFAVATASALVLKGPGVRWQAYSDELLENAASQGRPVVMDFHADWCAPCRKLEEITFHDPAIVKLSQGEVVMIKIDLTRTGVKGQETLLTEYDVKGVPTVIFIDGNGQERKHLRIVDYERPEKVLSNIARLRVRGKMDN